MRKLNNYQWLIVIMMVTAAIVTATSIGSLYHTAFNQHRLSLTDTVQAQARFIETLARLDRTLQQSKNQTDWQNTAIQQIVDTQGQFKSFGHSGEFNLFRKQDDNIEFVLSTREQEKSIPHSIPFAGKWAEAMRLALLGKSGSIIGPDYSGNQVLAAFEPVEILGLGLVAKIDMSEIRAPFIRAGFIALAVATIVVLLSATIFWRISQSVTRQLEQQAETFRTLVETAREGIILIDVDSKIQFVNPAAEVLFGYSQGELMGTNVSRLTPAPHRQAHDQYVQNYLETGIGKIIGTGRQLSGVRKNGSHFPMHLSIGDIKLKHTRLFAGVILDLSDQQQLQREIMELPVREQRRIGQELHDDLGQQLTGLSMLAASLLNKASLHDHRLAKQLSEGITQALSQVRNISRGLMPVEIGANELKAALINLCDEIEQSSGISINFEQDPAFRLSHDTAAMHLYRISQEALNNAVKHSGANQITLSLGLEQDVGLLAICDNGRGIADSASTPTGLGLRIMKYRSDLINGELKIDNNAESGTRINCRFPLNENPGTA